MSGTDHISRVREFLELAATGMDWDAWGAMLCEDAERLLPFAPPGLPRTIRGRGDCVKSMSGIFRSIRAFRWIDLDLHGTDESHVVYGTSRSYLELMDGRHYENEYVFIVKFADDLIKEFWEYLNPLPVMDCFAKELADGNWGY